MAKYRILWFDDDFQDSITSPNEKELDVNLRRAALYSDAELAADYDLEVNGTHMSECELDIEVKECMAG